MLKGLKSLDIVVQRFTTSTGTSRTDGASYLYDDRLNGSGFGIIVMGKDGVVKYAEQTATPQNLPNFEAVKAALAK